jgi:hypothetical protein
MKTQSSDRRRVLLLRALAVIAGVSFLYGFVAMMSHAWPAASGRLVGTDSTQLLPPLSKDSSLALLSGGLHLTFSQYEYKAEKQVYRIPRMRLATNTGSPEWIEVRHMWYVPQLAFPGPGYPWLSLFGIPLICCATALTLTHSRAVTTLMREFDADRARINAHRDTIG